MKKLIILLAVLISFSCQQNLDPNNEDNNYSYLDGYDPTNYTRLTAFIGEPMPVYPQRGTIAGMNIAKVSGVSIDFTFLNGDLETKATEYLSKNQLPDIINFRGEQNRFLEKKKLIPLNNLIIQYAPNLKRIIGNYWEALKESDGNIYIIPDLIPYGDSKFTNVDKGWWIQKAVLNDAGWPKVRKFEDYWKLIEDYKTKYPTINGEDTIGFLPLTYDWYSDYLYEAAPLLEGKYSDNPMVDKVNDSWTVSALDKSATDYRYLKFLNTQFNKGLIHAEGFNQNLEQYKELISTGRVLGIYDEFLIIASSQEMLKLNDPERIFVGLPLTWDGGEDQYTYAKAIAIGLGTSITTSCQDPVAAIKFLDTLVRDDITALLTWGVEGESYNIEADGKFSMTSSQMVKMNEDSAWFFPKWGGKYFYDFLPSADGTMDNGNPTRYVLQPSIFKKELHDTEKEILDAYNWDLFTDEFAGPDNERAFYTPLWSITATNGSLEETTRAKIYDLRKEYFPKAVMTESQKFENIWIEWNNKISNGDIEVYENFYQQAINERLSNYGISN